MALSPILEELINASLADGMISEKERVVLRNKGVLEGINPDEMDIIIDGRLQQMQTQTQGKKPKVAKCPVCGEIMPPLSATCPNCGYIVTEGTNDNVGLQMMMSEMEAELMLLRNERVETPAKLEGLIRQAKARYGDNARIRALIEEIQDEIGKHQRRMKEKEAKKAAQIRGKKMGCLFWSLGLCVLFFVSSFMSGPSKNDVDASGKPRTKLEQALLATSGCALICFGVYFFHFRKKYNDMK